MSYVFVAAGLVLLIVGGEFLVRSSVALADRLGLSPLLIGLVVVGLGTSAPELAVSVEAAITGAPGIAVGNVIGSSIANILLVFAIAVLILPMTSWPVMVKLDATVMLLASIILLGVAQLGSMNKLIGIGFVIAITAYITTTYFYEKNIKKKRDGTLHEQAADEFQDIQFTLPIAIIVAIGSIGILIGGAHLLINGATDIARSFGVSEAIIGLTLVAIGTSLPELATAIVAAVRRHHDVILGNIIGSNIFNIFCVLGVTASITEVSIEQRFRLIDAPILTVTCLALLAILWRERPIGRPVGLFFILCYGAYTYYLYTT
ncbi:MAG: calcium/sodium antiporter [Rhodospirillaceae bacterium]|jgi:cation:H+ antiporter